MASLSEQIAAANNGVTPSSTVQSAGGFYSPTWANGTAAIQGPAFGSNTILTGANTSVSGLDPKQLQAALDYINNAGGYNQSQIGSSYDQAIGTLQQGNVSGLNQQALEQMALLNGLQVNGQTMSPAQRDALIQNMPGYQFQFNQGQRAVESSSAAKGLLGSGAVLKALTSFGQGLASSSFAQYYGQLATLAGQTGQQAGQLATLQASRGKDLAAAASDTSNQYSNALLQGGNKATVTNQYGVAPAGEERRALLGLAGAWK